MRAEFPEKAQFLFKPAPYKVMHGGRGGAKSWSFTRALSILGTQRKLTVLHAREIQKSIKESVHKLLADQIQSMGLNDFHHIKDTEIEGVNGTRHVFAGIRNNISAIKSMEAIDVCAVYEATFIPDNSWDVLLPTIRRDPPFGPFGHGSEVWIEFNPELASDATYKRWVADPPPNAVVRQINWKDNPWFPEILRRQKDEMLRKDYDGYLTVWEGKTRVTLQGAIYAHELSMALKEDRIGPSIKPDKAKGVIVAFDLGDEDFTVMWFMQQIGMEHHAIDYYANCGFGMDHYLAEIEARKYPISAIWLPHDASHKHQAARRAGVIHTIENQVREVYKGDRTRVIPRIANKTLAINAVRMLFPRLYINNTTCADGLLALQHYQFEVDPETKERSKQPKHNWASHGADGLAIYAQGLREGTRPIAESEEDIGQEREHHPQAWMSA
jgi:phage terminase large subunit